MTSAALFDVAESAVALTSDDWYTPRWIFEAASIEFGTDVAAPIEQRFRTCPAQRYLTALDDGLVAPWYGLAWMNPPYSRAEPWIQRWADHPDGLALLPAIKENRWLGTLLGAAEAIALLSVRFLRPDGVDRASMGPAVCVLAGRGAGVLPLARIAQADRYARGAYHVKGTL